METFLGGCCASIAPTIAPLVGLLIDIFLGGRACAGGYSSFVIANMGSCLDEKEASVKLDCCYTTLTGLFDSKPLPTGGGLPKRPFPVRPSKAGS